MTQQNPDDPPENPSPQREDPPRPSNTAIPGNNQPAYNLQSDGSLQAVAAAATIPSNAALPSPSTHSAGAASGRRYGFLCQYCSSRLEATESMAAQSGTCPTCGNSIIIPILDNRGRLIDPTTNQIIKQDPHPVHAYAAAGHRAPQIVPLGEDRVIECPRCQRHNPIGANNCAGCGLPFTMEGTVGESVSATNSWAVASLVLGIIGAPMFCFPIPAILALIFGIIAIRTANRSNIQSGKGMATAGMILGVIGILLNGAFFTSRVFMHGI